MVLGGSWGVLLLSQGGVALLQDSPLVREPELQTLWEYRKSHTFWKVLLFLIGVSFPTPQMPR